MDNGNTKIIAALLGILFLLMLGLSLGSRDLWAPDEPRYAGIAQEMMDNGTWFNPTCNGDAYFNKPPGYFWLIIACSLPGGEVTPNTARMPSIFLGIAILMLLFLWLRKYGSAQKAHLPPLILITTYLFWWFGTRCLYSGRAWDL